ncbi:hypothetical protein NQ317_013623 [Molorchus minor]|uniref:Uncharacterized protein n=1 Tax=Molorchus minor TaxID=1323400 RepID=A0ABQ9JR75_9CUCU|nr:hypothetical protein NQ317_013623 [Molorchus minor]
MERNLYVINPCLAAMLDIWYTKYRYDSLLINIMNRWCYGTKKCLLHRKLRLLNTTILKEHEGPFDLGEFKYVTSKQIMACKSVLMDQYYNEVIDTFLQGNKRGKLPDPSKPKKMRSFYNSVAVLMTYHLQTLCLKSLYDYISYMMDTKVYGCRN